MTINRYKVTHQTCYDGLLVESSTGDWVRWDDVKHAAGKPIDMILYCPQCHTQHIDTADKFHHALVDKGRWTNPPHRSHLCHYCGFIWRPADVPTNGVAEIKTRGKDDSPVAAEPVQHARTCAARREAGDCSCPLAKPAQQDTSGWRPIATAPKNTPVRLYAQHGGFYDEDFNQSGSVEGHWTDGIGWSGAFWDSVHDTWFRREGIVPTHWQPLPEPMAGDPGATPPAEKQAAPSGEDNHG